MEIKESKFKDAGLGLYAKRDFRQREYLGTYRGHLLTKRGFSKLKDTSYIWEIDENRYIDGKYIKIDNPLRYVNGAKTTAQKFLINVEAISKNGAIHYRTIKCIKKGDEFIIDYGPDYWNC